MYMGKSARLVVVTREDISMYSGSRVMFTEGSPSLSRHKSEFIPTKKSLSVNSRKFKLLMKEDEEILAEPLALERSLSMMPVSTNENHLDPSLEHQTSNSLSRQVSGLQSNLRSPHFACDA